MQSLAGVVKLHCMNSVAFSCCHVSSKVCQTQLSELHLHFDRGIIHCVVCNVFIICLIYCQLNNRKTASGPSKHQNMSISTYRFDHNIAPNFGHSINGPDQNTHIQLKHMLISCTVRSSQVNASASVFSAIQQRMA